MSFTFFDALQIFTRTMELTIQPASVGWIMHSVHVDSLLQLHIDALFFIVNALPKQQTLKMHGFRHQCSAGFKPFDWFLLMGPRATPINLVKVTACVMLARWFTMRGIRFQRKSK